MRQGVRERIQLKAETGDYQMTRHATEEMADDSLRIVDVRAALYNGQLVQRQRDDPRGVKYVIEGVGADPETKVGVVGRFKETGAFLIITVYRLNS